MKKDAFFSEDELRDITQAYFSLTTREMIEYEILLIRAGLDPALPHILNETLASIEYQVSVRSVLNARTTFDDHQKRFLDYMWVKSSLDDTINHAYDICKRLGQRSEDLLVNYLRNDTYRRQLLSACILYKFNLLSISTIAKIKSAFSTVENKRPDSSLYVILLLILNKTGDSSIKEIIRKKVIESGHPEDKILEDSYYLVLLNLAQGNQ
jgi:hypothetical protein